MDHTYDQDSRFRQDYAALGIAEEADWAAARRAYRRQVNRWHPDRFAHLPRERAHAERRFIHLASAFNRLRQYYRDHERLPLQRNPTRPPAAGTESPVAGAATPGVAPRAPASDRFDPDALHRKERTAVYPRTGRRRTWGWAIVASVLVVATLATVGWIDRNERSKAARERQDSLQDVQPSSFIRSEREIRDSSTRGAFVERENGELGDQLMPDIFR